MHNRLFKADLKADDIDPILKATGFPPDIWKKIIEHIDSMNAFQLSRVCKSMFSLIDKDTTWINIKNNQSYNFAALNLLRSEAKCAKTKSLELEQKYRKERKDCQTETENAQSIMAVILLAVWIGIIWKALTSPSVSYWVVALGMVASSTIFGTCHILATGREMEITKQLEKELKSKAVTHSNNSFKLMNEYQTCSYSSSNRLTDNSTTAIKSKRT